MIPTPQIYWNMWEKQSEAFYSNLTNKQQGIKIQAYRCLNNIIKRYYVIFIMFQLFPQVGG